MKITIKPYIAAFFVGMVSSAIGMAVYLYLAGGPGLVPTSAGAGEVTTQPFYRGATNIALHSDHGYSDEAASIVNVAAYDTLSDQELSAMSLQKAYNYIAKQAIPGVVSIQVTTEGGKAANHPLFNDEFFQRFFGQRPQRPDGDQQVSSAGSGFVINAEGYIISNYHVIKDASSIVVYFNDSNEEYAAEVIGVDPDTDIALLKIEGKSFPHLPLGNSDRVETGDIVVAIGNPFGLSHTFTTGVISATGRRGIANKYENFIQTDTVINPGNSGGPLLNLRGEVIAINSNILSRTQSSIGLGFSIPINMAKGIVEELRATGKVVRGWIGIQYENMTKDVAEALSIENRGVIIQRVVEASPAEKAGIKAGDIMISFNRREISDGGDLLYEISKARVGATIPLTLLRNNKKVSLRVQLEEQREVVLETSTDSLSSDSNGYTAGSLTVRNMNQQDLAKYNTNSPFGVFITAIAPNSPLTSYGISPGDIIEAVNKKKTLSVNDFKTVTSKISKNKKILFQIRRQRSVYYIVSSL